MMAVLWLSLLVSSDADFAVRPQGDCYGDTATVNVRLDLNLTGGQTKPVRGFAYAVGHECADIIDAVAGADIEAYEPDVSIVNIKPDAVIQLVLVSLMSPDGILPQNDLLAMTVYYRATADTMTVTPKDYQTTIMCFSTGDRGYYPPPENRHVLHITCKPADFILGDVNADGRVDIGDAISILGYLHGGQTLHSVDAADMNRDGAVDIADAVSVLAFVFPRS